MIAMVLHGGDVLRMATEYGIAPESILDFSANVNPRGLPLRARERMQQCAADPASWQVYPDAEYRSLRTALAHKHHVPIESILIGAGATALLGATIHALQPLRCLLPVPAFSEYKHLCEVEGVTTDQLPLQPENGFRIDAGAYRATLENRPCDLLILTNPHNPSGALLRNGEMLSILERARAHGVFTIVDEAFIDYSPNESVIQHAAQVPNVAVVRSLTKFYGCPGLRVGFLAGMPELVSRIASVVATWPVTTLAAMVLEEAIQDKDFADQTLRSNSTERESLAAALIQMGAQVFPSHANFLLIRLKDGWPDSTVTRDCLLRRRGIAVRDCNSYAALTRGKYIRVAVRTAEENLQLLEGLREIWK
jgi:threonine-phosphate decarboxylase